MSKLLLLLSAFVLTSCGYTSRSTVHTHRAWKAHEKKTAPLPPVTLKLGQRTLAYKNRIGFPPMFGGYIPSLLPENPAIVKVELESVGRGTNIYLTGLQAGSTKIHGTNGMTDELTQRESINDQSYLYTVQVEE